MPGVGMAGSITEITSPGSNPQQRYLVTGLLSIWDDEGQGLGRLLRRLGLAREGCLVDAQRPRPEQPQVRRYDVPGIEPDQIAGHHLRRRDEDGLSAPHDACRWAGHPPEGGERLFRAIFLDEPHDPVEDDDREDDERVLEVSQDRRDAGGREQHDDHRVRELLEEQDPGRLRTSLGQLVAAVLEETPSGVRHRQTTRRVRAQGTGHRGSVEHPGAQDVFQRITCESRPNRGPAAPPVSACSVRRRAATAPPALQPPRPQAPRSTRTARGGAG